MLNLSVFLGGFGSYLLGLNKKTYELAGVSSQGNSPESFKEPGIGWMTGYLFLACFVGLFVLIPLRKVNSQFNSTKFCSISRDRLHKSSFTIQYILLNHNQSFPLLIIIFFLKSQMLRLK